MYYWKITVSDGWDRRSEYPRPPSGPGRSGSGPYTAVGVAPFSFALPCMVSHSPGPVPPDQGPLDGGRAELRRHGVLRSSS